MKKPLIVATIVALALGGVSGAAAQVAPAQAASTQAASTAAITGRVFSDKGTPIRALTVIAGSTSTISDSTGRFVLRGLKPGTYTVEFTDPTKHRYLTEFLGDSPTAAGADTVTLAAGEKHTGVSERLTHAALVSGVVTVDGNAADTRLGSIAVTLTDTAGAIVARADLTKPTFSLPGLPAGTYTLAAREQGVSYPHIVAATKKVTVTAGQQLNDQSLAMSLVKGVVQASQVSVAVSHIGAKVKLTIATSSYLSVSGGVVTLRYHRVLHHATTVGSSGRATITIPTSSWKHGTHARVDVLFDGPMGVASSKAVTHFTVR